jgi:CheY-like chemotaxis protein
MSGCVLIVDDDAAFRRLANRLMAGAGLTVAGEAADAAAALAIAQATRPDGILVDVGLPDRDGVDVARELAALPWGPRVLLTSSDADAQPDGHGAAARVARLPFVPKQDLPNAGLATLLGS